jgi:hypothetical protein
MVLASEARVKTMEIHAAAIFFILANAFFLRSFPASAS